MISILLGVVGMAVWCVETKDVEAGRWGWGFWVRERTFHPCLPGECQAEGNRGLQISLWASGQCWVFSKYLSLTHFEEFL